MKVRYSRHFRPIPEGHLFFDKEGSCTVQLSGAASMSQAALDYYGKICAIALSAAPAFKAEHNSMQKYVSISMLGQQYLVREWVAEDAEHAKEQHAADCGCQFELVGKGMRLPDWLKLPAPTVCQEEQRDHVFTIQSAPFTGAPTAVRHIACHDNSCNTVCGLKSEDVEMHADHELDIEVVCKLCESVRKDSV